MVNAKRSRARPACKAVLDLRRTWAQRPASMQGEFGPNSGAYPASSSPLDDADTHGGYGELDLP